MQGHGDTTLYLSMAGVSTKNTGAIKLIFKNKYKVVAIDLPGFGTSSKSGHPGFYPICRDVHEVIRQLNLKQGDPDRSFDVR